MLTLQPSVSPWLQSGRGTNDLLAVFKQCKLSILAAAVKNVQIIFFSSIQQWPCNKSEIKTLELDARWTTIVDLYSVTFNYDRKANPAGFMLNRRSSWVQLIELYECKISPEDISAIKGFLRRGCEANKWQGNAKYYNQNSLGRPGFCNKKNREECFFFLFAAWYLHFVWKYIRGLKDILMQMICAGRSSFVA